jgi:predicted dehydrogenase
VLRGAIIGVGKIAQTGHLPAFEDSRLRNRARIVAAVDPSPNSRSLAARQFPQLHLFESIQEMLDREAIDFVDVCTTPRFHGEVIETAVRHKLHVLCEKPVATSVADARRIAELLRQSDPPCTFIPCHQYRYSPLWQHFKTTLAEEAEQAGSLLQFNVFRTGADPGLPGGNRIWRTRPEESGGGILADTGVHYLYLTHWMLGTPERVTARIRRLGSTGGEVEDTALVTLERERWVVQITLTWGADRRANSARLVSKSTSLVYNGSSLIRTRNGSSEHLPVPDASEKSHYVDLYVSLITEFIDHIQTRTSSSSWINEAVDAARILEACYASAATGTTVNIT